MRAGIWNLAIAKHIGARYTVPRFYFLRPPCFSGKATEFIFSGGMVKIFQAKVAIIRIVDLGFPVQVECVLHDIWNNRHTFVDKAPIFTCANITAENFSSQAGYIRCEIVRERQDDKGKKILTISTKNLDGVETSDGITEFDLMENQIRTYAE